MIIQIDMELNLNFILLKIKLMHLMRKIQAVLLICLGLDRHENVHDPSVH